MLGASDKIGYECRLCGTHIEVRQADSNIPCPKCGSTLTPSPKARYWIFQFNPKIYNWFNRMKDTNGRKPEQWLASRYSEYMKKDDFVAIRSSGKNAGIYALGQLLTGASDMGLDNSELIYWLNQQAVDKFLYNRSVLVTYCMNISHKPILDIECSKDEILNGLKKLTCQQATNIQITQQQWARIVTLASSRL